MLLHERFGRLLLCLGVCVAIAGCEGLLNPGDDDDDDDTNLPRPTSVEESLDRLGVDRTETPRQAPSGETLPEDYSPLGSRFSLRRYAEVAFLGIERETSATDALVYVKNTPDAGNNIVTTPLHAKTETELPWAKVQGDVPTHFRWATTGDVNGDGTEELLIVYRESGDMFIRLRIVSDEDGAFASADPIIVTDAGTGIQDLKIVSADFDGDGLADAAIATAREDSVQVVYLTSDGTTLGQSGASFTMDSVLTGAELNLRLAAANLDYDNGAELGMVLNEIDGMTSTAAASFTIRDDIARGLAELEGGLVQHTITATTYTAQAAGIAFGNITGDPLPEIVLGGITDISDTNDPEPTVFGHVVYALGDVPSGMANLGGTYFDHLYNQASESGQGVDVNTAHVHTVDLLGDGRKRVVINQFVLDPAAAWAEVYAIPDGDFVYESGDGQKRLEHHSSAMVISDVTQDGREDIVYYTQDQDDIRVRGVDMIDGWEEMAAIDTVFSNAQDPIWPVLIPTDVDDDGIAVQYSGGEYRLVFTEPIIIAALAAAPCNPDWGQDIGACATAFGEATSSTVSLEDTYTLTAGVTVGFSQEFSVLGVSVGGIEVLANVEAAASTMTGESYTLTTGVVHTTGPIEDSVLFTSVPMDQWTYTIISHPNPELIGGEIVVSLPREPIQAMVTRELFNASVLDEADQIGPDVFAHTPGDPRSYPSRADKDAIIAATDGLETAEVDVGQGGGTVAVDLSVYEEVTQGSSYAIDFSLDVQATAGVVVLGFSVGYGEEHSVSISNGEESSYTGVVANLDAENFAANPYSFGLFTYITERNGQQFETLNYWTHFQDLPSQ